MSRVTIGQLVADYNSATFEERQKSKDFEVVPRKIAEDIIEACLKKGEKFYDLAVRMDDYPDAQGRGFARSRTMEHVAQLGHELLERFEEGEEA